MAVCPVCGKEVPGEFPFCPFCAAPLTPGSTAAPLRERKVVSVLFCDLVGFTAASESADPEDVQGRLASYHARARERIEAYGGTVEKFVGDAVMAVFGAPVAHEDDAERAVRAGLALLETLEGSDLSVRIGVNTGVVVVSVDARPELGEGLVTGDVVNTAARIQAQAPVNGVAVGEETFQATERVFEYEPLAPIEAKGKADPVGVWRALRPAARFGSDVIRSMTTPLVGRELDFTLLRGTLDKVIAEGSVQLVTVVGEPGVGKSRLVAELFAYTDALDRLVTWRQGEDFDFLERVLHKLLLNFTWWVNRKDAEGNNLFEGGFLGLDNIGAFDRSQLPILGTLEQSDGTAWMAMYCQNLLELTLVLAEHARSYEDLATKFYEHFALIAAALNDKGLWDEQDGFYYDILRLGDGTAMPLKARSVVGLLPLTAVTTIGPQTMARLPDFTRRVDWFTANRPEGRQLVQHVASDEHAGWRMLSIVDIDQLRRLLTVLLDEAEFFSPHGIRALSRYHADHPLQISLDGLSATLDYEPGESTTGLFGGNSNWRGPIWFPINYLLLQSLRVYHRYLGDAFQVECPTGSGRELTLAQVADELAARLAGIFLQREDGTRPVFGGYKLFQQDPAWHNLVPFHEYFHGDTGAGLGASHQTGWTGLVADLIMQRPTALAHEPS